MRFVFIVGCGRSGTHFLRNILNQHSKIWISGELHYFSSFLHNGFIKSTKKFHPFNSERKLQRLFELLDSRTFFGTHWKNRKINIEIIKDEFYHSEREYSDLFKILLEERTLFKGKIIGGEKTPSNLFHINKISEWLPEAKFLHIVRDPRAIFVSEIYKEEKPDYFLSKNNPFHNFGLFVYVYIEWLLAIRVHKKTRVKNSDSYKMIKFNDLVRNHKDTVVELCQFLDVDFEKSMLNTSRMNSSFSSDYDVIYGWKSKIPFIYKILFSILLNKKIKKFT